MPIREQIKTASWLNVIAGIWLIISPFMLGFAGTPAATNTIIVGIIIGALSLISATSPSSAAWTNWLTMLLGIWMIVSPFIMGFAGPIMANSIILGIVVLAIAAWSSSTTAKLGTA